MKMTNILFKKVIYVLIAKLSINYDFFTQNDMFGTKYT